MRGEIYLIDLSPRSGSEQAVRRPGVIVSNNAFTANPRWRSVTVVPLTSAERWQRPSPTTVLFAAGESNLPKACAALAHQITTVDKDKIISPPMGILTSARMAQIESALSNYLLR